MGRFIDFLKESAIKDRMNDANKIRDPIERAIAKYVLDPFHAHEVAEVIHDAIERYGNDEPMTIYRGLNFSSKEEYDSFMRQVDSGKIKFESISSWSPSRKQALVFAKTKPSYMEFMSASMWSNISNQSKAKERITGYRGVVLKTEIPAGKGLDIRKTGFGVESEVILPAGAYNVEIEELKTFKDTIADDDVNSIVSRMQKKDYDSDTDMQKMLEYIMHHHPEEFNDESKGKIFKLLAIGTFKYEVRSYGQDDWFRKFPTIDIYMSKFDALQNLSKFFLKTDYETVLRKSKPVFLQMLKDIEAAWKPGTVFEWNHGEPGTIAEMLGCRPQYISMLQRTVGADYKNTTTREHNRKVTDLDAEAKRVVALLKSMK
jgi:hypothetical protein